MAFYESCLADIELLNIPSEPLSEEEINILNALARGMQPDEAAAATEAAQLLNNLSPSWELDRGKKAKDYWWEVFGLIWNIARSYNVPTWVQERLIAIILELHKILGERELVYTADQGYEVQEHIWNDILLIECLAEHIRLGLNDDPTTEYQDIVFNPSNAQRYQNISWFAARLQAVDVLLNDDRCILALTDALETDLSTLAPAAAECRILVACGWLVNCSRDLLEWSQAYDFPDPPPSRLEPRWDDNDEYPRLVPDPTVGPLYPGPPALCPDRWDFWLARLDDIASEASGFGDPVRHAALEAAKAMRAAEEEAGIRKGNNVASRETNEDTVNGGRLENA